MKILKNKIKSYHLELSIALLFPLLIALKGSGFKPFSLSEITIWAILITLLPFAILSSENKIYSFYTFFILSFVFCQITSFFCSNFTFEGITSILVHDKYIILSFLIPYIISSENIELNLMKLMVGVSLVVSYFMIFKICQNPGQLLSLFGIGGFNTHNSVFPNPNMAGVYIGTLIFVQLLFVERQKKISGKVIIFILIVAPSLFALLMTFSRRAWISYLCGMLLLFILKRKSKFIIFMTVFFTSIVVANIDYMTIWKRVLLIFDGNYKSNSVRFDNVIGQISLLNESYTNWIIGLGVGTSGPWVETNRTHCYYLLLLIEYGLIGLIMYCSIVAIVLFVFFKTYRIYKTYNIALISNLTTYLLCYVVLLVSAFVGYTPITFPSSLLQWLFVGLILSHYNKACTIKRLN